MYMYTDVGEKLGYFIYFSRAAALELQACSRRNSSNEKTTIGRYSALIQPIVDSLTIGLGVGMLHGD
jgi:hypothetical protein